MRIQRIHKLWKAEAPFFKKMLTFVSFAGSEKMWFTFQNKLMLYDQTGLEVILNWHKASELEEALSVCEDPRDNHLVWSVAQSFFLIIGSQTETLNALNSLPCPFFRTFLRSVGKKRTPPTTYNNQMELTFRFERIILMHEKVIPRVMSVFWVKKRSLR